MQATGKIGYTSQAIDNRLLVPLMFTTEMKASRKKTKMASLISSNHCHFSIGSILSTAVILMTLYSCELTVAFTRYNHKRVGWSTFNAGSNQQQQQKQKQQVIAQWGVSSLHSAIKENHPGLLKAEAKWFPEQFLENSELESASRDEIRNNLEHQSLQLMSKLLLHSKRAGPIKEIANKGKYSKLAEGRFRDLCCTKSGERILEHVFEMVDDGTDIRVVQGGILSLQSLLVLGMQYGAKADIAPKKENAGYPIEGDNFPPLWNSTNPRRMKDACNRIPAIDLLAEMKKSEVPKGHTIF